MAAAVEVEGESPAPVVKVLRLMKSPDTEVAVVVVEGVFNPCLLRKVHANPM